MANGYSWSEMRGGRSYRLPGPEHLGWWAAVAMLLSILLHVAVFLLLDRLKIAVRFEEARELSTRAIDVSRMEVRPLEIQEEAPPEQVIEPPKDSASLLEEVDLLNALPKNVEIDIKPEIKEAEYELQLKNPALVGDPAAVAMEVASGFEVEADLPEMGRQPEQLRPAEVGQVTVDPGAVQTDDDVLSKFGEDLVKKGANGKAENGALDGIASLDDLLGLPPNVLLSKKTMLPSDLLFEFNKSELRESAKVGLMKIALLMDRNPELYCWIEGHTDLVGGDEFNLELSIRRAEAVKSYLVESMRMDASRIITRGFGRYSPLVIDGDTAVQAMNRRVEIRMRKSPPTKEQMKIAPKKAAVVQEAPPANPVPVVPAPAPVPPEPPKAVLVKPQRALPVEEPPPAAPRAEPVEGITPLPEPPKASPVEPLRAQPVAE